MSPKKSSSQQTLFACGETVLNSFFQPGAFLFLGEIPAWPFFGKPFFGTRQYCTPGVLTGPLFFIAWCSKASSRPSRLANCLIGSTPSRSRPRHLVDCVPAVIFVASTSLCDDRLTDAQHQETQCPKSHLGPRSSPPWTLFLGIGKSHWLRSRKRSRLSSRRGVATDISAHPWTFDLPATSTTIVVTWLSVASLTWQRSMMTF